MKFVILHLVVLLFRIAAAVDSLTLSKSLTDGPNGTTLVSKNGVFELGFFSPRSSQNRYLGIWHKNRPVYTCVWVANRNNPINDSSGILIINRTSDLTLLSHNKTNVVWSAKLLRKVPFPMLQLLITGNLVLRDEKDANLENYSWQSSDDPTDTFLPEMKLGWDLMNSTGRNLSIRKIPTDTSPENLTMNIEVHNGKPPGEIDWRLYTSLPRDDCDNYAMCGAYGYCDIRETPLCKCLKGFEPRSPDNWKLMEFGDGCRRNKPLKCQDNVGFELFTNLKLPDMTHSWVNRTTDLKECRERCFSNCFCVAYAITIVNGSDSGCVNWFGDLMNLKLVLDGGQDLYVRMLASELVSPCCEKVNNEAAKLNPKIKIGVGVGVAIALTLATLLLIFYVCKKRSRLNDDCDKGETEDMELPLFELSLISNATNNFSFSNKLGEGGFGSVYKGKLIGGQDIAVKRLSKSSGQGLLEFKNEVMLIAKLQHRNLVRLLGYCIQGEEKMLVYEYMPNKSLDTFIFDEMRRNLLDWSKRFRIICGIARGLVYLHEDSRLRIIHRDLKASNVLLDLDMNPKISDFGLAKTCGGDQTEGNTKRVVGTYGYMAPEYAIDGQFSAKSDVFSFGILLLEIVSGKRNRRFYHRNLELNLIGYAWRFWVEGNPIELIDECIGDTYTLSEVLRCIHISLLCIQQHPDDRPTMSSIVLMLGSESTLPQPKEPGFFMGKDRLNSNCHSSMDQSSSTNELTLTLPDPR